MPKRKKSTRRSSSTAWIAPVLLLAVAIAAGIYLFRPAKSRPHHRTVAVVTEAPSAVASATPEAVVTPTETPVAATTATPTAQASPTPTQQPKIETTGRAKLALIIDDCGQWVTTERGFIALPIPLTLSVLPHVHAGTAIMHEAADAGKGVMLHLPMETLSGMDPGPGKITTAMTDAQIDAQVQDDLAQVPLAAGVNNHEGSKASADARVMHDVVDVMVKHGNLFFVDSRTNAASVGESEASKAGIPTAARDVFLDNKEDVAYSEAQLREAARIALKSGSAIAIGHPRPTTLEAVRALIPELQSQGIQFVLAQNLTH